MNSMSIFSFCGARHTKVTLSNLWSLASIFSRWSGSSSSSKWCVTALFKKKINFNMDRSKIRRKMKKKRTWGNLKQFNVLVRGTSVLHVPTAESLEFLYLASMRNPLKRSESDVIVTLNKNIWMIRFNWSLSLEMDPMWIYIGSNMDHIFFSYPDRRDRHCRRDSLRCGRAAHRPTDPLRGLASSIRIGKVEHRLEIDSSIGERWRTKTMWSIESFSSR